jgi:hypothetical protein
VASPTWMVTLYVPLWAALVWVHCLSASGARKLWVVVVAGWYRGLETFVRPVCEVVGMVLASNDGIVCLPGGQGWG